MRSHGITMVGTFTLEKVNTLPTFDATRDDGRLIYLLSTGECYLGADTEWVLIDKNSVILDDHENRITQDDSDIDWLNTELDDHIDSRDEHPTNPASVQEYIYLATEDIDGFDTAGASTGHLWSYVWYKDNQWIFFDRDVNRFYVADIDGYVQYTVGGPITDGDNAKSWTINPFESGLMFYGKGDLSGTLHATNAVSLNLETGNAQVHGDFFASLPNNTYDYYGFSSVIGYSSVFGQNVWILYDFQTMDITVYPFSTSLIEQDDVTPLSTGYSSDKHLGQMYIYNDYIVAAGTGDNGGVTITDFSTLPSYINNWNFYSYTGGILVDENGIYGDIGDMVRYHHGINQGPWNADYGKGLVWYDGLTIDEKNINTSEDGFMSASDKIKLNGLENNADNYSLETHNNDHHTENYLTTVSAESLGNLSDVSFLNLNSGDSLAYDGSWVNKSVNFSINKSLDSNTAISGLVGGAKYFIIIEYVAPNKGTGGAYIYFPVVYDSSGNVIQHSSTYTGFKGGYDPSADAYYQSIEWFDGNMSRTSTFLITAPSNGYVKFGPGWEERDQFFGGTYWYCYAISSMLSIHALRIG